MAASGKSFSGALGRISTLLSSVVYPSSVSETTLDGIFLRRSGPGETELGLEAVMPDGSALTVKDDDVGRAIRRVYSLFKGRSLKVVCCLDFANNMIKLIKVETMHNSRSSNTRLTSS